MTNNKKNDSTSLDYHALNAMLNLVDNKGEIQFTADKQAVRQYFLQHVNKNTLMFDNLRQKVNYLTTEHYYETAIFSAYSWPFLEQIWQAAFKVKFRFETLSRCI